MTNEIIIKRNDQGHYAVSDYMGTHVFEQRKNLLGYIECRLDQQDKRIAEYQARPEAFTVNGISELTY